MLAVLKEQTGRITVLRQDQQIQQCFQAETLAAATKASAHGTDTVTYTYAAYVLMSKATTISDPKLLKQTVENLFEAYKKKVKPRPAYVTYCKEIADAEDPCALVKAKMASDSDLFA